MHSPIVVDIKIPAGNLKETVLEQPVTGLAATLRFTVKQLHAIPEHQDIPKEVLGATVDLVTSSI